MEVLKSIRFTHKLFAESKADLEIEEIYFEHYYSWEIQVLLL